MMRRTITQRELRNDSGEVMRALDRGEQFTVTRNGTPVGELLPTPRASFVDRRAVLAALSGTPPIDAAAFRADVDALADQDISPRA